MTHDENNDIYYSMSRDDHPTNEPAETSQALVYSAVEFKAQPGRVAKDKPVTPQEGNVVYFADFLERRIEKARDELVRVEKKTGIMMNRLIREKDHAVARKLQRDIGRLDSWHASLNEQIGRDSSRQKRFIETA